MNLKKNIIKSNKGKNKLAFEGFFYNQKEICGDVVVWRCNKRGCRSFLKTNTSYDFLENTDHGHQRDELKFEKVMINTKIKARALSTEESGRDVVYAISGPQNAVLNSKTMNDLVSRTRKEKNFTIEKFYDIPIELQKTSRNRTFLFFDSGMKDENRIVVFTTENNLEHFFYSKIVLCDGTFKSAPSDFEQLFTIQCNVRNDNLPLIYCFMKNRREVCYSKFFDWLGKQYKEKLQPKSVIMDFEIASYNCCKQFFIGSNFYGCLFHLGQIVWRRVQIMQFSKEFKENYDVRFNVKLILALSFVPEKEVLYLADRLKTYFILEEAWDVLKLFEWFKENYLVINDTNKSISFWNSNTRVLEGIPRTTNSLEGFHRHLNNLVRVKQTSFSLIASELKKEQEITEKKYYYHYTLSLPQSDSLKPIIEEYDTYIGIEFLKKIVFNYNWKLD